MIDLIVIYRSWELDEVRFEAEAAPLRDRVRNIATEPPIAHRKQNFGDYRIPEMALHEGLETPGEVGFALHVRRI